jgi:hypothetical protein
MRVKNSFFINASQSISACDSEKAIVRSLPEIGLDFFESQILDIIGHHTLILLSETRHG